MYDTASNGENTQTSLSSSISSLLCAFSRWFCRDIEDREAQKKLAYCRRASPSRLPVDVTVTSDWNGSLAVNALFGRVRVKLLWNFRTWLDLNN
jgi:hypothetical protein